MRGRQMSDAWHPKPAASESVNPNALAGMLPADVCTTHDDKGRARVYQVRSLWKSSHGADGG